MSQQEQVAFDFFATRTSVKLPGVFDSVFWDTLVFQAGAREPAVLHAIVALGAVDLSTATRESRRDLIGPTQLDQYEHLALRQYNKAIRDLGVHFDSRSRDSLHVALITCMVFICIELLRGQIKVANTHLANGLKLLSQMQRQPWPSQSTLLLMLRTERPSTDDYLIEAFTRLSIHSPLFSHDVSFLYIIGQEPPYEPTYEIPPIFETFREARLYLDELINGIYCLSMQIDNFFRLHHRIPSMFFSRKERLHASLSLWLQAFDASRPVFDSSGNYRAFLGIPLLRIYYTMATIMVSACDHPGDEMVYDLHHLDFASIINRATELWDLALHVLRIESSSGNYVLPKPSLTADMGFIPPLYYTAIKCRVPSVRRQAIDILLSAPHREGVWDGVLAASIARSVMDVEEAGLCTHVDTTDDLPPSDHGIAHAVSLVPESARVHRASVEMADGPGARTELTCKFSAEADGTSRHRTVEIDLIPGRLSSGSLQVCARDLSGR